MADTQTTQSTSNITDIASTNPDVASNTSDVVTAGSRKLELVGKIPTTMTWVLCNAFRDVQPDYSAQEAVTEAAPHNGNAQHEPEGDYDSDCSALWSSLSSRSVQHEMKNEEHEKIEPGVLDGGREEDEEAAEAAEAAEGEEIDKNEKNEENEENDEDENQYAEEGNQEDEDRKAKGERATSTALWAADTIAAQHSTFCEDDQEVNSDSPSAAWSSSSDGEEEDKDGEARIEDEEEQEERTQVTSTAHHGDTSNGAKSVVPSNAAAKMEAASTKATDIDYSASS